MPNAAADLLRFVNTSIVIGQTEIPVLKWSVTQSNQGSMAKANAETTLSLLNAANINLVQLSQAQDGAEFDVYAGYDNNSSLIFSGVLDECEGDEGEDTFTLSGRDHAAAFNDGMQTTALLKYRNQTIGQIVTQIANMFGFTPNVIDPGIPAGAITKGESSLNARPQTYWSLLQKLADDVGYECYVTPANQLYFGPEQNQGTVTMSWMRPAGSGAVNPLLKLKWRYNPRNNSNIKVNVISVQGGQQVIGSATANQVPIAGATNKSGKQLSSRNIQKSLGKRGGSGSLSSQKSSYQLFVSGMTPAAAQAKAEAMAKDLAKRQIIIEGKLEGLALLVVHNHIQLNSGSFLDTLDFNVAEVSNSYSMPEGYMTEFRALALVN